MIDKLREVSKRKMELTNQTFVRDVYDTIEWSSRCILLNGCRGVGKTYLMFQYLKTNKDKAIYFSLDNLYFLTNSISDTVEYYYNLGFRYFGLDEIHKYKTWSIEIKNIYDNYPDIQMVLSSSSALDVMAGVGDLSRRLDEYTVKGLSFLEFLKFEYKISLTSYSWEELINTHEEIYEEYYHPLNIQEKFNNYIKRGYYPFYKEAGTKYHDRLQTVILQVIDTDMAAIFNIDYEATRQIKKLLSVISNIGPFSPNISKLSRDLALNRISVLKYLDFLSKADILSILNTSNRSDSVLSKPEKIYFENTNLLYAFDNIATNSGTIRETFTMNALSKSTSLSMPLKGDFMIDEKYIIEVGGKNKNFDQIKGMPNTLFVKDGIERGGKNIIPMWCLGFLKTN